jgi:hypothetical protein
MSGHVNLICAGRASAIFRGALVGNLAGSSQVAPTYWLNPTNGVSYPIVLQTPQYQIDSLSALENLPITAAGAASIGWAVEQPYIDLVRSLLGAHPSPACTSSNSLSPTLDSPQRSPRPRSPTAWPQR